MADVLRKRNDEMREQLVLAKSQHNQLVLELEAMRVRRMGLMWFAAVLLSALLIFHSYSSGSILFVWLNAYAFLSTWRALYVVTPPPLLLTASVWLVIGLTLKAV